MIQPKILVDATAQSYIKDLGLSFHIEVHLSSTLFPCITMSNILVLLRKILTVCVHTHVYI